MNVDIGIIAFLRVDPVSSVVFDDVFKLDNVPEHNKKM